MALAALIFDVDGTLADTEEAHRCAFNQAFRLHGLPWHWDAATYRRLLAVTGGKERMAHHIEGLSLTAAERLRLQLLLPALHASKTGFYTARVVAGQVPLRGGVARLLEEALTAGCRLAIASTTTAANVQALLQATLGTRGMAMFSAVGCGDAVPAKKPAPDIYRWVLNALAVPPSRALAFEDSVPGLRAATAAGLATIVTPCPWTAGDDFTGAALLLPGLGGPQHPLQSEPGGQLESAAWLTVGELQRRLPAWQQPAAASAPFAPNSPSHRSPTCPPAAAPH